MKKLLSFFSLLAAFNFLSLPSSAQGTNSLAAKTSKTILVTFSVNMELERLAGYFHPGADTVSVGGNFNAWEKSVMTPSQSNPDIYSTTISVTDSVQDTIRFNFCYSPDIWEVSGVREFFITQANYDSGLAVLDTIGFDSEPISPAIKVEFRCNMTIEMRNREFVRGEKVFVRGDFNGWSGNDFELKDVDGDSIYSRIFYSFKADQKLTFKFTHTHNGGDDVWESTGNRRLTVSSTEPNIFTDIWENGCFCTNSKTIHVTFSVNMELERLQGLFNPSTDSVFVRGSFNGWGKTYMPASETNPDYFETTTSIILQEEERINFKYFYSPETWEVNHLTDSTQNDRYLIVSHADFDTGTVTYNAIGFNNASLETVLNQDARVTFTCNTIGAKIINTSPGTEFKTIHIAGENFPLEWPNGGWSNEDSTKMIKLYDDGTHDDLTANDKIFTTTITFPKFTLLNIDYKYGANWGLSSNGGGNDNEATVGNVHHLRLNRFTSNETVIDTFGILERGIIWIGLRETSDAHPSSFDLEQNYPNPFNPETIISWQLAASSYVTLKVFDVLGNEVATLVNEEQPAGSYKIEFSSKNTELSSGIYFYQLRAGDFVQTKKMILLR